MPLLSIVMPCFNTSSYIEEAVNSVVSQTFKDWELLIIDDGSTDNTHSIALKLASKNEGIKVYKQENRGVSAARNFGYSKCVASDFLFFLDSDDVLLPTFLEVLIGKLKESKDIAIVYSDYQEMDKDGNRIEISFKYKRLVPTNFWLRSLPDNIEETPLVSIYCGSNINESTSVFRRKYFDAAGGWNVSLKYAEGMELFLKIALLGKIIFIPNELFRYRRHNEQSQSILSDIKKRDFLNKAREAVKDHFGSNSVMYGKVISSELFLKTRVRIRYLSGTLKHNLRYHPILFIRSACLIPVLYLRSLVLIFYRKYWV